ncbi:MAG: carbohydrate ABC transporter permease [Turicibacter sp.]
MKLKAKTKETLTGYGFISIWIFGFLVFTLIPIIKTFNLSFNQVKITTDGIKTTFIGMQNYKDALFMNINFADTLVKFALEIILFVPIIIVFAIIISLLLNMKIKFRGFFRTIFFLPVIITSGPVMQKLMDQGATTLPGLEEILKGGQITELIPGLMGNMITTLLDSFILILWFCGVQILIFIASLQKANPQVYEAASIDGASRWEAFWKITLPSLKPIILVNVVYTVITLSMSTLNDTIKLIQEATFDITTGLGYASAMSWIYFVEILVLLLLLAGLILFKGKQKKHVKFQTTKARSK